MTGAGVGLHGFPVNPGARGIHRRWSKNNGVSVISFNF